MKDVCREQTQNALWSFSGNLDPALRLGKIIVGAAVRTVTDLFEQNVLNQPRKKGARQIELALERVITEAEINERATLAQNKFIKAAAKDNLQIEDVFGRLEDK